MSVERLQKIMARAEGASHGQIAALAGMAATHLSLMLNGKRPVHKRSLVRLDFAVQRFNAGEAGGNVQISTLYRVLLVLCAKKLGLDAAAVQATNPNAKLVASEAWVARVHCHFMARYLLCEVFALGKADLARALGLTRQAVQKSVRMVEERATSQPEFETALEQLMDEIMGVVS